MDSSSYICFNSKDLLRHQVSLYTDNRAANKLDHDECIKSRLESKKVYTKFELRSHNPFGTEFMWYKKLQLVLWEQITLKFESKCRHLLETAGLDIKQLVYMTVGHVDLKVYMPCKNFHVPSQYLCKPCKGYVHCWENKYMPRLKNHLPCRAHNHNSLCALRQDLHALGMRAHLNVKPCERKCIWMWYP